MKDARGHGSNKTNGISVINPNGGNIAKALAQRNAQFGTQFGAASVGDRGSGGPGFGGAVTSGGHGGDWGDEFAAKQLASGPKSAPVPVHDSMSGGNMSAAHDYGLTQGTGPTKRPTSPAPDSTLGRSLAARRAASLERLD